MVSTGDVGEELYGRLKDAMDLLWNSELDQATDRFSEISLHSIEEGCPSQAVCMEAHVRLAQSAWLQAALSEVDSDASTAFTSMKAAEVSLQGPCQPCFSLHVSSLQAELSIMKALLQLRTGSYFKGAYNLRKSWKLYDAAMKRIPSEELNCTAVEGENGSTDGDSGAEVSDSSDSENGGRQFCGGGNEPLHVRLRREAIARVKFGIAAFHFFVSIIPQSIIFLVELIGFEADRQSGYAQIQACFREQSSAAPVAGIILLWIETFFMENFDTAHQISQECLGRYPGNIVILYLSGYLERQQSRIDLALQYFSRASTHAKDIRQFRTACLYEQADCYWRLTDWEKAVEFFESFNESNVSKSYRCFGAYQEGVALCFLGEESRAKMCFSNSTKWARRYFSFDAYAARKSGEFLKRSPCMSDEEKTLVESNCLRRQGRLSESVSMLRDLCDTIRTKEKRDANVLACALYQLGRALREEENLTEALKCFQECVDLGKAVTREKYTIPHCLLEIGMLRLGAGDAEGAKAVLSAAKKYSSYDFDKPNIRRIMRCLDRAKEMLATPLPHALAP